MTSIHLQHVTTDSTLLMLRAVAPAIPIAQEPMSAYLIIDVTGIHDEPTYATYRSQVSSGLRAAGGTYLARGGAIDVLEGDWRPGRVVVVRFESTEAARQWWTSGEYEHLKRMRQASTTTNAILVEGVLEGLAP